MTSPVPGTSTKTMLKRLEQYHDRWTSYGAQTGILSLSDKPTPEQLQKIDIFKPYGEKFLERISTDVSVAQWRENAVLFEEGSYIDMAFFIVDGEVEISLLRQKQSGAMPIFDESLKTQAPEGLKQGTGGSTMMVQLADLNLDPPPKKDEPRKKIAFLAAMDFNMPRDAVAKLGPGEFFGEIGAMSGWPQSVTARTATSCKLVQIRLPALRLMKHKSEALKERIDALYRKRSLLSQLKTTPLFSACDDLFLQRLMEQVELVSCQPGEVITREGEPMDAIYMVRSGFVKLTQNFGEGDIVVNYLSKGMTWGETELLLPELDGWEATTISVEYAELVKVPIGACSELIQAYPKIERKMWKTAVQRIKETGFSKRNIPHAEFRQVALDSGLVQGNSVLVIDLERCTRCDDCVRACAATHGGRPRFIREGIKYENLLIARSCYHCRDPVCLAGCPTGAIHRSGLAEVVEIDDSICIGCSACADRCPYDAIVMHPTGKTWPGDMIPIGLRGQDRRVASKCDQCKNTGHGPACVSNCPQGCASRVGNLEAFQNMLTRRD